MGAWAMGAWAWWASVATALAATLGWALLAWRYGHWRRRGVPAPRPLPLVGSFADAFLLRKTIGEVYQDIYKQFPGQPVCGFFKCLQPALLVRDPEVVGSVLARDFASFRDNDVHVSKGVDPMFGRSPFAEKGDTWKHVRGLLTPTFTASRMRGLSAPLAQSMEELALYIRNHPDRERGLEVKRASALAATEAVARCMLGVQGGALRHPDGAFASMCAFLLDATLWDAAHVVVFMLLPALARLLRIRFVPESVAAFFREVVEEATAARRAQGPAAAAATDYLQHSIALRDKHPEFEAEDAAAHAAMFFMDGFEPTSTALALALHHVALDEDVQGRARDEVDEVLAAHGGRLDHDTAARLAYLDMVVCETLRMYPPLRSLDRVCVRRTELPCGGGGGGKVAVEAGTPVLVPVHALQHDPLLYPDPTRFDPERFSEEQRALRPPFAYLPFGEGPRACLGQRYAMTVMKLALATVLREWRLEAAMEGEARITHDVRSAFYFAPAQPLRLRFLPRRPTTPAPAAPATTVDE